MLSLNEAVKVWNEMRESPRAGNQLRLAMLAMKRPINSAFDAYMAVFANPKAIQRAEHLPSDEYKRLVRITAHIDSRVLKYAKLDKSVEEWLESIPDLKLADIPFDLQNDAISEKFYMRVAEKCIETRGEYNGISTKLSMPNYTKLAELTMKACPVAIQYIDASKVERAAYQRIAKMAVESYARRIEYIEEAFIDDYEGLLYLAANTDPSVLHYCADIMKQLPHYGDLLVEYVEHTGVLIAHIDCRNDFEALKAAVKQDPWAIKAISRVGPYGQLVQLAMEGAPEVFRWARHEWISDGTYEELAVSALVHSAEMVRYIDYSRVSAKKHSRLILAALEKEPMGIRQLARYPIDSELFNKAALIVAPHPHAINGEIIAKLAPELQEDVLWRAIQHDGVCIKYAPPRLLNKEYCEAAVKSNGIAALYIRELLTPELIECAIKQNPAMLGAFTAQEVGPNYAELAIEACRAGNKTPSKDDPDAVFLFKKAHRGKNQILSMVDPNGLSSEEYEELCAAAVAANPENIKYVQYPLCRAEVYGALLFGLW